VFHLHIKVFPQEQEQEGSDIGTNATKNGQKVITMEV